MAGDAASYVYEQCSYIAEIQLIATSKLHPLAWHNLTVNERETLDLSFQ